MRRSVSSSGSSRVASAIALGTYLFLSVALLAGPVALHPQTRYVGSGADPQNIMWSFAWWPHALAHGQNPFVTRDVWAPFALNLAWIVSMPALALAMAPVTLLAGPVFSYDVAALALPAVAAL